MASEFLSVEMVAGILGLHPKTVLRFIREGRLRATRVGKQYRVLRTDLNSFAGALEPYGAVRARVTSIIDIDDVDAELLQRLSAVLIGASKGNERPGASISLDIAHDPIRRSAKVIVTASPADAAVMLGLIETCLEDPPMSASRRT